MWLTPGKTKKANKKTHRSDKQGMESKGRAFRGVGQQLFQMEASRGHLVQPPASKKDRFRGVPAAVKFSCVYRSQGESCPWMLIQRLLHVTTTVSL